MSRLARISFALLGLLGASPEFVACSANDSAVNTNSAGAPHNAAGAFGVAGAAAIAGPSGAGSLGGAGMLNAAGAFAQGGLSSSAGAGGTNTSTEPSAALGGSTGVPEAGSAGTTISGAGTGSAGSMGSAGAAGASAAFAQVSAILGKNCGISGCHADKQAPHFVPGPMLYATLTGANTVLAECDYAKLVEAGDPSKSGLVRLMNKQCGSFIMPPSCNKSTCLSAADLKSLSDWIQAGAPP